VSHDVRAVNLNKPHHVFIHVLNDDSFLNICFLFRPVHRLAVCLRQHPIRVFTVSLLQAIDWDTVATLQNPFQDGVIHAGVAAFDMAFNYSDSRPVSFNDINLVSTPCPHCQPKTLT